ncbi:MAG: GntR family transcriptional regulator [Chitinivibrionales bacterium]|nr:GntR family transcriptional regulator [Chitinivibrionales bacterium]
MPSALLTATTHLNAVVNAARAAGRARLPTVARLAQDAGVSPSTMWQALQSQIQRGILRARPRSGITLNAAPRAFAAGAVTHQPDRQDRTRRKKARPHKWQAVADRVRRDILDGVYPPGGALPQRKELAQRYGIAWPTLTKALDYLVHERILEPHKRRVHVPAAPAAPSTRGVVVLIAAGDSSGELHMYGSRQPEYLRALEDVCARASVDLAVVACDSVTGTLYPHPDRPDVLSSHPAAPPILGFLLWSGSLRERAPAAAVQQIVSFRRPIAMLDEDGDLSAPWPRLAKVPVRQFRLTDGYRAGSAIGNRLLALGHRSVAYLSPSHRAPWSRGRLRGLKEAYARAGLRRGVTAYTVNDRFSHELHLHRDFPALRTAMESLLQHGHRTIAADHELVGGVLSAVGEQLEPLAERVAYKAKVAPLFERALRNTAHTAWVCANDTCAVESLHLLRGRGMRVPSDLSLVGFDNAFGAFTHGLASFDFNSTAAMQAMLGFVLQPGQALFRGEASDPVVIQGHIVMRRSLSSIKRQA